MEPIVNHQVTQGVMVTSTYGNLCPGSRWRGIILQNLLTQEVQIPPKTVIGNVQKAKVVPNLKVFGPASLVLPLKEQMDLSRVSEGTDCNDVWLVYDPTSIP